MEGLGLSGATKRVAEHARSLVGLEVELAVAELKKKFQALGIGVGLMVGAAVLAFLALTFGLAAAAAGLSTTLSVWLSLLIVCAALIALTAILVVVGRIYLQKGSEPIPEQAVEEARLTTEALRNGQGD
jgi:membrane protein implicated in regulation of membrane protease activity